MQIVRRDPTKAYLDAWLWIPKDRVNVAGVKRALTFTITEDGEERALPLWREGAHHLLVPRTLWKASTFNIELIDCRPTQFESIRIQSRIQLDKKNPNSTTQRDAVRALLAAQGGILNMGCGKGKTVCAIEAAVRIGHPTLFVVDNTVLLEQWKKELFLHLQVTPDDVGVARGAKEAEWWKPFVLTTYQTLASRGYDLPEEVRRRFGTVILDEGHHSGAETFSIAAVLFYGRRYALTATWQRQDGRHVVYENHVGPVLYRNLKPDLPAQIGFLWTGIRLTEREEKESEDRTGSVHLARLSSVLGKKEERADLMVRLLRYLRKMGRTTLYLSTSVSEVADLYARWNGYPKLYSSVVPPTPEEVGYPGVPPILLAKDRERDVRKRAEELYGYLQDRSLSTPKRVTMERDLRALLEILKSHDCAVSISRKLEQDRSAFVKKLLRDTPNSTAGLITRRVDAATRLRAIAEKPTLLAVMRYGKEGLDKEEIDTVVLSSLTTYDGGLAQIFGRSQRLLKSGATKQPIVLIIEDDIPVTTIMSNDIRRTLRDWPEDQGGPYTFANINHPKYRNAQTWSKIFETGSF